METMLGQELHSEAQEFLDFLSMMNEGEQKEFLIFLQGIKFAKQLDPSMKTAQGFIDLQMIGDLQRKGGEGMEDNKEF